MSSGSVKWEAMSLPVLFANLMTGNGLQRNLGSYLYLCSSHRAVSVKGSNGSHLVPAVVTSKEVFFHVCFILLSCQQMSKLHVLRALKSVSSCSFCPCDGRGTAKRHEEGNSVKVMCNYLHLYALIVHFVLLTLSISFTFALLSSPLLNFLFCLRCDCSRRVPLLPTIFHTHTCNNAHTLSFSLSAAHCIGSHLGASLLSFVYFSSLLFSSLFFFSTLSYPFFCNYFCVISAVPCTRPSKAEAT